MSKKTNSSISIQQLLEMQAQIQQQLLEAIESESEEIELHEETAYLISTMLEKKADAVAAVIHDVMPTHIEFLKSRARAYSDAAKAQENSLQRIKQYVQYIMESQGLDSIKGGETVITLTKNSKPTIDCSEVSEHDYANTDMIVTRIEYKWDKARLEQIAKTEPEKLPPGIKVKHGKHVRIKLKKM